MRMALVVCLALAAGIARAETAHDVISDYNARPIAANGWQSVQLDLLSGEKVSRSFGVENAWRRDADGTLRTLFLLQTPEGLRGTIYLLTEDLEQADQLGVALHLPVGLKGVVALQADQLDEGLLGSDFAYRDIRWLLPTEGMSYALGGRETMLGRDVTVIHATPTPERTRSVLWEQARYYIASDPRLLLGADYIRNEVGKDVVFKQMRVERIAQIEGHWIATSMRMRRGKTQQSRITLRAVEFSARGFDPHHFLPTALPFLGQTLRTAKPASERDAHD